MTALTIAAKAATMTSREIAELTGKEHKHVLRDIRGMLEQLSLVEERYAQNWTDPQNGQTYTLLALPKDLTITLVSGYSVAMRHRIVTRWQELESQSANPVAALTRLDLLKLAIDSEEKRLALQHQVEVLAPKAEVHDRIADAEGSITIRETANTLQIPERKFVLWLLQHDWCYRRAGHKSLLAYADKVKAGLLCLKQTPIRDIHTGEERLSEQVRVTPLGLTALAKRVKATDVVPA